MGRKTSTNTLTEVWVWIWQEKDKELRDRGLVPSLDVAALLEVFFGFAACPSSSLIGVVTCLLLAGEGFRMTVSRVFVLKCCSAWTPVI